MWKEKLWKKIQQNPPTHNLWINQSYSHFGCLQKSVAALSKNPLFHINFLYND